MRDLLPRLDTTTGSGPLHFVLLPGLVPDASETFLRQRRLLLSFGSVTTVTYPYQGFDLDQVVDCVQGFLLRLQRMGDLPVPIGVSVGGGLLLEALRRWRDQGETPPISALALISPLSCTADLAPLLKRLLAPIVDETAQGGSGEIPLERGRAFFRSLASRSVPSSAGSGWPWNLLRLLTPSGLAALGEARIRTRIERTLDSMPPSGAVERVLSLQRLPGIEAGMGSRRPLAEVPALLLWGSKERHTLDMAGPGSGILCRPDLAVRHFPTVEVHWLYGDDGEEVPHASLLRHHRAFNRQLRSFIRRLEKRIGLIRLPFLPVIKAG